MDSGADRAGLAIRPRLRPADPDDAPYVARLATTDEVRDHAFALRYRSYRGSGHIPHDPRRRFSDAFDERPNARTVVLYREGLPVGSVRVCLLRPSPSFSSPGREAFRDEVEALIADSAARAFCGHAVEVNRLVRAPEHASDHRLVFLLYRMAGFIALADHFQIAFACVRANHVPFYRRLGYAVASAPRLYPGLNCGMLLMTSPRRTYDEVRRRVPPMDPLTGATTGLHGFLRGEPARLRLA